MPTFNVLARADRPRNTVYTIYRDFTAHHSPVSIPAQTGQPIRSLQLPRVRQTKNTGRIPREQEHNRGAADTRACTEGYQGAAVSKGAFSYKDVICCNGRDVFRTHAKCDHSTRDPELCTFYL